MKIIKFKPNIKYKYQRKVFIKDLTLNIFIGIHNFEKKRKQNFEKIFSPLQLQRKDVIHE